MGCAPGSLSKRAAETLALAVSGQPLGMEALKLLASPELPLEELMKASETLRARHSQDRVDLCAIVNAKSGACPEDCRFCSQSSRHSTGAPVFPLMSADRIKAALDNAVRIGALRLGIVTSGKGLSRRDFLAVCRSIQELAPVSPVPLCASLGALTPERARDLASAGLKRYHHNVETSQNRFASLCTTHTWEHRVETIARASAAGLEVCAGGIFGFGEDWNDRVEMAVEIRSLPAVSVPLNFLLPVPGTPLADAPPLPVESILRIIAIFRLAMPDRDIRIGAGRAHLGHRQGSIFCAGANGMMVGDFLTRPGQDPADDRALVRKLGFRVGPSR